MTIPPNIQADYDLIIIGAGIGGLIMLQHACAAGLKAVILEKRSIPGGLWNDLPRWQDVQSQKQDWSINDFPISSELQGDILANICHWPRHYDLALNIHYGEKVLQAVPLAGAWRIETQHRSYTSTYLIVASGGFNKPYIPEFSRTDVSLREFHSYDLKESSVLKGKSVTVVGGSASALDLIDQAFLQGAAEVHWVYRSVEWMMASLGPKTETAKTIRPLGFAQMLGLPRALINRLAQWDMERRYKKFGMNAIKPPGRFDFWNQLVLPGRSELTRNFSKIIRHPFAMTGLSKNRVITEQESFETDIVLYGTGYHLDLSYLQLDQLTAVKTVRELASRCGGLLLSLDYSNLFFMAIGTMRGNGPGAPFIAELSARSIVAHIQGKIQFPQTVVDYTPSYYDFFKIMARFDLYNYRPYWWRLKYLAKAFCYLCCPKKTFRF